MKGSRRGRPFMICVHDKGTCEMLRASRQQCADEMDDLEAVADAYLKDAATEVLHILVAHLKVAVEVGGDVILHTCTCVETESAGVVSNGFSDRLAILNHGKTVSV